VGAQVGCQISSNHCKLGPKVLKRIHAMSASERGPCGGVDVAALWTQGVALLHIADQHLDTSLHGFCGRLLGSPKIRALRNAVPQGFRKACCFRCFPLQLTLQGVGLRLQHLQVLLHGLHAPLDLVRNL
jgi:hypothetical protein